VPVPVERAITIPSTFGRSAVEYRLPWQSVESRFRNLVARWKTETAHVSSVKAMIDRSYLGIIGIGPQAVPLLLRELKERPDHWLVALSAITQEDPAPEGATFNEAVDAWIKWGMEKNYLT
jgi:hypothetical protein